jgi:hypothetical protein
MLGPYSQYLYVLVTNFIEMIFFKLKGWNWKAIWDVFKGKSNGSLQNMNILAGTKMLSALFRYVGMLDTFIGILPGSYKL